MSLVTDFIVIGSGVAGLRASIALAETGADVTVLTKDKASESNTEYAQGGVAVVLSDDDDAELHEGDTLVAGADVNAGGRSAPSPYRSRQRRERRPTHAKPRVLAGKSALH